MYTLVSNSFGLTLVIANINLQVTFVFALLALAHAKPSYYDDGIILKGPSGVITKDGPIGPTGPATGGSDEGKYAEDDGDDGSYPGDKEYESPAPAPVYYAPPAPAKVYYAPPAPVYYAPAPAPAPAYYAPAPAYSAPVKGVAVTGPKTVPALIAGPVGKIYAEGLYSPPAPKKYN